MKRIISSVLCIVMALSLCACGSVNDEPQPEEIIQSSEQLIRYSSYEELKNQLDSAYSDPRNYNYTKQASYDTAEEKTYSAVSDSTAAYESSSKDSAANDSYSKTNVQVEGVDEGDIVKTDGEYIYVLSESDMAIFKADGADSKLVSKKSVVIKSETEGTECFPREMYVSGNRAVIVLCSYVDYVCMKLSAVADFAYIPKSTVTLAVYDVTDKASPKLISTVGQDGSLMDSRMLDGTVYVVTYYGAYSIQEDSAEPAAPSTYCNYAETKIPVDCIVGVPNSDLNRYAVICSYDIENASLKGTLSVLGSGGTLYMNSDNIYIASSRFSDDESQPRKESVYTITDHKCSNSTTVTRVDISTLQAVSCGTVPGTLDDNYSMDEYNGYLRIATTDYTYTYSVYKDEAMDFENWVYGEDDKSVNALYILDGGLNITGKAENIAEGETIYSVRYDGDIVYLCTFRQVDPLFVYDVSNPAAPVKLSELKINGFSEYMHVWEDGRLFGLGMEADDNGVTGTMKLVMFDTTDKTNVSAKNVAGIDSHYSTALYNPNAILIDHDRNLIGLPTQNGYDIYGYTDEQGFTKLAGVKGIDDTDYDMRGMYIGDSLYIIGMKNVTVIDMNTYETTATLSY